MELVYLWVEDYKNIQKQGFNFSPWFECSYDENTKELTIDENKEYVSIFPENINITAIVGENGSGKSNLLDLILDIDGWAITPKQVLYLTFKDNRLKLYLLNFNDKVICQQNLEQQIINRTRTRINQSSLSSIGAKCSYLSLSPFLNKLNNFYSNSSINFLSIYNYKKDYENNTFNFNDFFFSLIPSIPKLLEHSLINSFFKIQGKPEYLVFKIAKEVKDIFPKEVEIIFESSIKQKIIKDIDIYMVKINNTLIINLLSELNEKIETEKQELKLKKFDNIRMIELYFTDQKQSTEFYFSTGELVLLYYIEKLQELNKNEKNIILLIDECELFLHPEWQKKFIQFLSELFVDTKCNYQIIISSHSPFILSDLPKENVIFLKDGKQVNVDINPFGANIHTLLSHGFFMKDGLMGEFAKGKIDDAIKLLNKPTLSEDDIKYCENIISIIGEPILKRQMQRMLDSKRLSEVEIIKKQIIELQEKLDKKEDKK